MKLRRLIPRFSWRTLILFTLLCTSGFGLWWHWEPWYSVFRGERVSFWGDHAASLDSLGRQERAVSPNGRMQVLLSFQDQAALGSCDGSGGPVIRLGRALCAAFSRDGTRIAVGYRDETVRIWDVRKGDLLYVLEPGIGPIWNLGFDPRAEQMCMGGAVNVMVRDGFSVFRRRRPEWWWGVFWLKEFWATAAFAALLLWSVLRDRRSLAARPSPEP